VRFLSRRPPLVAPPEVIGQPGHAFGVTVSSEPAGWTLTAYGSDGRRLGRPLKGLSEPVLARLTATVDEVSPGPGRERLATAWMQACRGGVTNADVLLGFSDAATQIAGDGTAA
jgi:hypothetical protein